eukprot:1145604-Pelagomonas_calceolata.AAC.5
MHTHRLINHKTRSRSPCYFCPAAAQPAPPDTTVQCTHGLLNHITRNSSPCCSYPAAAQPAPPGSAV